MITDGPETMRHEETSFPDERGRAHGDAPSALRDATGRHIDYIRLSLTDRCNFRCIYCMPHEGQPFIPHSGILSYEELRAVEGQFGTRIIEWIRWVGDDGEIFRSHQKCI